MKLLLRFPLFQQLFSTRLTDFRTLFILGRQAVIVPGRVQIRLRGLEHLRRVYASLFELSLFLLFGSCCICCLFGGLVCGYGCFFFSLLDQDRGVDQFVQCSTTCRLTFTQCKRTGRTRSLSIIELNTEIDQILISESVAQFQNRFRRSSIYSNLPNIISERSHRPEILVQLSLELFISRAMAHDLHQQHRRPRPFPPNQSDLLLL